MAEVKVNQEIMENAIRAQLIIEQQSEILNEQLLVIAGDFGVSKGIAKKIVVSFAKDTLEKTSEKMEDERAALANADVMIQAFENLSFDPEDMLEETAPTPTEEA